MNGTIEKELLEYLLKLERNQQNKVLEFVKALLLEDKVDYADRLDREVVASIELGLRQVQEGKTISHEEVKKKYQKWLSK